MTKQISSIFYYDGKEYLLDKYLLREYFEENPEKKPQGDIESSMWEGYFADYEIIEKEIYLKNIFISKNGNYVNVTDDFFNINEKKLNWLNTIIFLNENKRVFKNKKDHLKKDKSDLKQFYRVIEIKNGKVNKEFIFNYEELLMFEKEQYDYFLLSDEYLKLFERFKKIDNNYSWDYFKNEFSEYLKTYILDHLKEIY